MQINPKWFYFILNDLFGYCVLRIDGLVELYSIIQNPLVELTFNQLLIVFWYAKDV